MEEPAVKLGSLPGADHTVREIGQQPRVWNLVAETLREDAATQSFLRPLVDEPSRRIVLTGAGTSAFGGRMVAPAIQAGLGRPVEAIATTDLVARPHDAFQPDDRVLLVSFARSGNSPESVAATEIAEQLTADCRHLVVTCAPDGDLARRHRDRTGSRVILMPAETNDQGFAMTSSITSMMLATLGAFVPSSLAPERVEALAGAVGTVLKTRAEQARHLVSADFRRIVYLGSGVLRSLAEEAALKILELTGGRMLSYHDTPLGFRHGPKSLLDADTLVVVLVSRDRHARAYDLDILAEMRAQLGTERVLAFVPPDMSEAPGQWRFGEAGEGPGEGPGDWPLVLPYLVAAQLLALHASVRAGRTPDNPFPSGEVNRVVQGVTIHPLPAGEAAR